MKDAANGLRWCVAEMERRYKLMAALGVRNLRVSNQGGGGRQGRQAHSGPVVDTGPDSRDDRPEQTAPGLERLPAIVVVIDEFADMMMVVGKRWRS